jgi:DNA-binding NarL/FixJ family response regulator
MTRVYLADARPEERSALRLLLHDLNMEIVGEASDWFTVLVQAPINRVDILLVDWDMIPNNTPNVAVDGFRKACPTVLIVALINRLDSLKQIALSVHIDAFISKDELPERIAERLRAVAASVYTISPPG